MLISGDCENPDVCDCTCTCGKKSGCTCYDLSDITYTVEEIEDYLLDKNLYAVTFDFMLCLKIRADSSILNEYLPDHLRISPEKPTEIPFNDEEVNQHDSEIKHENGPTLCSISYRLFYKSYIFKRVKRTQNQVTTMTIKK